MAREIGSVIQAHTVEGDTPVDIHVLDYQPFPFYGHERKSFVVGDVGGEVSAFVERNDGIKGNGSYSAVWLEARESGLPVVPNLLRTPGNRVLVPDVKSDGSEVYGKALACSEAREEDVEPRIRFRPRPHIDTIFLDLVRRGELRAMKEEARALGDLATKHNVRLPTDDSFEVKVRPDSQWELVLLDLGFVTPRLTSRADPWTLRRRREALIENNQQSVGVFCLFLNNAVEMLSKQTSPENSFS